MRQHESILSAIALLISIAWAGCAATSGTITLQAYSFGRGQNAAGTKIPSVGFDPFVGLFSATGPGAVFIDGTSDVLSNCSPGCPPAGTLAIGSIPNQWGDVYLQFTDLTAGPTCAAGSLCNSHTLAVAANVDAGCARLPNGKMMETSAAGEQLTYE